MKAAYPWFGGKSRIASTVWEYFGDVTNYVEPFFGGGAVLLQRPSDHVRKVETVNDIDGFVSNFWRAVKHAPDEVAEWANWPINENDLHARHLWLVTKNGDLAARLEGDPDYYDAKVAGWWVWGISCKIGAGWCSGKGPWAADEEGRLVKVDRSDGALTRALPDLSLGRGVNRGLPSLSKSQGVHRPWRPSRLETLLEYYGALQERFERVRVCCGDWKRVCGHTPTTCLGETAVFLDPPYEKKNRANVYTWDGDIAQDVRDWAIEHGDKMKVALCGYESETYQMPDDWIEVPWKAVGGYGNQGKGQARKNCHKERVWFSPLCERKELI